MSNDPNDYTIFRNSKGITRRVWYVDAGDKTPEQIEEILCRIKEESTEESADE